VTSGMGVKNPEEPKVPGQCGGVGPSLNVPPTPKGLKER
jgi:hypothetical protein